RAQVPEANVSLKPASVAWPRSIPSTKRLIRSLRQTAAESYSANQITKCVFTQPGSEADITRLRSGVRFTPQKRTFAAWPALAKEMESPKSKGTAQLWHASRQQNLLIIAV